MGLIWGNGLNVKTMFFFGIQIPIKFVPFHKQVYCVSESCKGNWNISMQSDTGSIDFSWSLPEPKSSKFKYAIVYYPSVKNIKSQATKSTSLKLDILEPNTEYVFRLFAFVPGEKDLYFCTRRARTDPGKYSIYYLSVAV